jgi:hypothetical protein
MMGRTAFLAPLILTRPFNGPLLFTSIFAKIGLLSQSPNIPEHGHRDPNPFCLFRTYFTACIIYNIEGKFNLFHYNAKTAHQKDKRFTRDKIGTSGQWQANRSPEMYKIFSIVSEYQKPGEFPFDKKSILTPSMVFGCSFHALVFFRDPNTIGRTTQ